MKQGDNYYEVIAYTSKFKLLISNIDKVDKGVPVGVLCSELPMTKFKYYEPVFIESYMEKTYLKVRRISSKEFIKKISDKWKLTDTYVYGINIENVLDLIESKQVSSPKLTSSLIKLDYGDEYPESAFMSGVLYHELNAITRQCKEILEGK